MVKANALLNSVNITKEKIVDKLYISALRLKNYVGIEFKNR